MSDQEIMMRSYMQSLMMACAVAGFAAGSGTNRDLLPFILEAKLRAVLPTYSEIQIQEMALEALCCMDKFCELAGHFDGVNGEIQ